MIESDATISLLRQAARAARENAHCPYSQFAVGAAVLAGDGVIYRGANIENASYGLTICAERAAIFAAVSAGAGTIKAIALVTSSHDVSRPCGACRQVIAEFSSTDSPTVVITESVDGAFEIETIEQLLPHRFNL
jgi:cytidine deaminase